MHTCSGIHLRCYATGGVGVGWGGDVHVLRRCTHVLAFMLDVTQQVGLGWGGLGMFTFLEDAHMFWHSC